MLKGLKFMSKTKTTSMLIKLSIKQGDNDHLLKKLRGYTRFHALLTMQSTSFELVWNWWRWKVRRQRERQAQEIENEDQMQENDSEEDAGEIVDGQLCVICLGRQRRSAFVPCGHLVCFPRCAISVELDSSPNCPVCSRPISLRQSLRLQCGHHDFITPISGCDCNRDGVIRTMSPLAFAILDG